MRRIIGAATGPREGFITVVCDDGAVFVGLLVADTCPLDLATGLWDETTPIPGTERGEAYRAALAREPTQ